MGWYVSNGLNAMPSYYPASQFRKTFYRPDVIKRLFDTGNLIEPWPMPTWNGSASRPRPRSPRSCHPR